MWGNEIFIKKLWSRNLNRGDNLLLELDVNRKVLRHVTLLWFEGVKWI